MTIKCSCGQLILVGTFGTQKQTAYYDNRGNSISNCPKCAQKLSNNS